MNVVHLFVLLFSVICCAATVAATEQVVDGEDICRLHKDGTVLLKPGLCDRGIKCQNSKSVDLTSPKPCSGSLPHFNPSNSKCSASIQFDVCDPKKKTCSANSPQFISDPYACHGYITCNKKQVLGSGYCPDKTFFDEEQQSCVYSSHTLCTATYEFCDVTPANVKFQDPANCTQYLTCVKSLKKKLALEPIACEKDTFFDVSSGKCIATALAVCDKIPVPWEICGTVKLALRNQFVSDRATCRGYFYCRDLGSGNPDKSPTWSQCPVNTFFSEEWKACVDRANTQCKYDRCDGRTTGYELSPKYGCQHYYECKDNIISDGPIKCENNMYFDAYKRQCTSTRTNHGVCS